MMIVFEWNIHQYHNEVNEKQKNKEDNLLNEKFLIIPLIVEFHYKNKDYQYLIQNELNDKGIDIVIRHLQLYMKIEYNNKLNKDISSSLGRI